MTALDSRALSLFRMGLGLVLLSDLLIRFSDLEMFYTDAGSVPRSLVWNTYWNPVYIPLHTWSGHYTYMVCLFGLAIVCALLMVLGWKTRLFTFLSWFLLISLHNRNPYVQQGGDDLLRLALFWGMFLPLGRHYSIDARLKGPLAPRTVKGLACTGYVVLIFSVYFFSALQKNSAEWQTQGSAIYYALSLDQIVLPAGKLIYPYPLLLKCMTHAVYLIELLAGFLLFFPGTRWKLRLTATILFALLHLGIGLTLYVGLFFIIGLVTLLPFLPKTWMDRLDRWLGFGQRKFVAPSPGVPWPVLRSVKSFALGGVIVFCLAWNISNVPFIKISITHIAKYPAALLRIDQNWGMFAPTVFKEDGWFIYEGVSRDGKHIDINRNGKEISYEKPANIVSFFKNDRWRKYSENILMTSYEYLRPSFCRYLFLKWNKEHPARQLDNLFIIYMKELTLPDYKTSKPVREVLVQLK